MAAVAGTTEAESSKRVHPRIPTPIFFLININSKEEVNLTPNQIGDKRMRKRIAKLLSIPIIGDNCKRNQANASFWIFVKNNMNTMLIEAFFYPLSRTMNPIIPMMTANPPSINTSLNFFFRLSSAAFTQIRGTH